MKNLIATTLAFSCALLFLRAGEQKSDLDRLQGTWVVVSLHERGKALPAADIAMLEITVEKDVYTAKEKGETVAQYKFKIDSSKKPAQIDFTAGNLSRRPRSRASNRNRPRTIPTSHPQH